MLLRMASPMKRPDSTVFYLRQRIPADVLAQARGQTLRVPIGDGVAVVRLGRSADTVKASLHTRDPREAKERKVQALSYLETVGRSLREPPRRLTQRQVIALAGEWYRAAKARWEDDPGPATVWEKWAALASAWDTEKTLREMHPFVAELLEAKGLNIDTDSRERLAFAV